MHLTKADCGDGISNDWDGLVDYPLDPGCESIDDVELAPITTTGELADVVRRAKRARETRIDPATRVFQALRIAVNREIDQLSEMLDRAVGLLAQDGRLVVISYHSLEDRVVKNRMRDLARGEVDPVTGRTRAETQVLELLTPKPVVPSADEVAANPRARSARLRAARRL